MSLESLALCPTAVKIPSICTKALPEKAPGGQSKKETIKEGSPKAGPQGGAFQTCLPNSRLRGRGNRVD